MHFKHLEIDTLLTFKSNTKYSTKESTNNNSFITGLDVTA